MNSNNLTMHYWVVFIPANIQFSSSDGAFTIADYGTADGGTSMVLIRECIGNTRISMALIRECIGNTRISMALIRESIGNTRISMALIRECIGNTRI